ncbi:hypothetical protein, partial [Paenibacillus thiaminolyticus]
EYLEYLGYSAYLSYLSYFSVFPYSFSIGRGRYYVRQPAQEIEGSRTRLEGERTIRYRIFCSASSLSQPTF